MDPGLIQDSALGYQLFRGRATPCHSAPQAARATLPTTGSFEWCQETGTGGGTSRRTSRPWYATAAWELPPLNLLLMGTVDWLHPSEIEQGMFDDAWDAARPI
jgi:hypothetical protein